MPKMRVLVVDDSVVVRRVLANVLSSDPAIDVVGTAPNGRIALAKIAQATPDLVTLDVEMPEMGGLETLAALRKTNPLLPVIMFSAFIEQGSPNAANALAFGSVECVTKPVGGAVDSASTAIRNYLIPKIKGHLPHEVVPAAPVPHADSVRSVFPGKSFPSQTDHPVPRVDVVVIGASTGGPSALEKLLAFLPDDFPVPILIVQHMPAGFTALLANRLAAKCRISVAELRADPLLCPGHAWLAAGGRHMVVKVMNGEVHARIFDGPPENSCRPSADVLFRSAAEVFKEHVLAVVMTGMGQDGLRGCEKIREAGGQVLAQDQASSVVWGMPGLVANAGLVNRVVGLDELGREILRRVMFLRPRSMASHRDSPRARSQS
ncbi:MAG TPA: chemotaxis-specific protein-glutamate methyltransferase CheB [Verrucomicrobiae bacterium]|nr:chemotaxis-specific protein-glutamate methyltransferase CheB [Verrucomicrobiae bacterium]